MHSLPKITIVTPSFNQADFLEQTIDSILSQNYPNLEYIVMDGGSMDQSAEIIKKYDKHLTYWVSEKDAGQTDAINKGLARSTGGVFNWINSDDYLEPGSLKIIGELFKEKNPDLVCGVCRLFNSDDNKSLYHTRMKTYGSRAKNIAYHFLNQQSTFWNMKTIAPFLPLDDRLNYLMDLYIWDLYNLSSPSINIERTDSLLSHFRIHKTSKTNNDILKFYKEEHEQILSLANIIGIDENLKENYKNLYKESSDLRTFFEDKYDGVKISKSDFENALEARMNMHYYHRKKQYDTPFSIFNYLKKGVLSMDMSLYAHQMAIRILPKSLLIKMGII